MGSRFADITIKRLASCRCSLAGLAHSLAHTRLACPFWAVVEIDKTLHRESFKTSTGTAWPPKNDGRVVVRILLQVRMQGYEGTRGNELARELAQEEERRIMVVGMRIRVNENGVG